MPVPVEAEFQDGTRMVKITDRLAREQTLQFVSPSPPKHVRLDPNQSLALVVPPPTPKGAELTRLIRELEYGGPPARVRQLYELAAQAGSTHSQDWLLLGLHLYNGALYPESLEAFRTLERYSGSDRRATAIARVWQGHLLDLAGRRGEALSAYREALAGWPEDLTIQHDQWQMKIDRKWVEERLARPFARE
jgi:tetratricopeptide (TPR) repeat protein